MANSFSTKELAFELLLHIMKAEKFMLALYEDEEEVLAMIDDRAPQRSQTSPKSLDGL